MPYGELMKDVRERAGVDEGRAEKAVRASLNTLAQRLDRSSRELLPEGAAVGR